MSKKLLQLNVTANWGSTGTIAEGIGQVAVNNGWKSTIAYGRGTPKSKSDLIRVGSDWDMRFHGLQSRFFDNHGLASKSATRRLVDDIKEFSPDIIHLHNIHGYYLNYPILFDFLKSYGAPIVWTLHDCWSYTGHCAYYDFAKCDKWKTGCHNCPQTKSYPSSLLMNRSTKNYALKKKNFLGDLNITFVPVSNWLRDELKQSFLGNYPADTIHNGIDLDTFKPKVIAQRDDSKKVLLGVASVWDKRKGLDEFISLRKLLPNNYLIILVGLSQDQISTLPAGITGIRRTENVGQLVDLYSMADLFINPTLEDNFPTTNLEALACGTPVITYRTGGSPEAIDDKTGLVVEKGNVNALADAIMQVMDRKVVFSAEDCRIRAEENFNKFTQFNKYIDLYKSLLSR